MSRRGRRADGCWRSDCSFPAVPVGWDADAGTKQLVYPCRYVILRDFRLGDPIAGLNVTTLLPMAQSMFAGAAAWARREARVDAPPTAALEREAHRCAQWRNGDDRRRED